MQLVVALTDQLPQAQGRTWTEADYAIRDARLQALGLVSAYRTQMEPAKT